MGNVRHIKTVRVNLNLPSQIVERVRTYADSLGLPYTQAYIILLTKALDNTDALNNLTVLNDLSKKIDKLDLSKLNH